MDVSALQCVRFIEIPLYNIICTTDTDNYVNVWSTIKKETKSPVLLKLPIYSTELAAVIFFKSTTLNAQKDLQRSHWFMMNVLIWQFNNSNCSFFFHLGFLSRTFTIHRTTEEGEGYLFNSSLLLLALLQTLKHKPDDYNRELASAHS